MDTKKFIQEYGKFLKGNFNAERAKKEKAYLYSDLKHHGISVPGRNEFYIKHKKEIKSLSKADSIKLAKYFWGQPSFEKKSLALHIMQLHLDELNASDMPLIESMMRECRGWALLDSLIIPFMPTILAKDKNTYKYLHKWIKDGDFWTRRSALLAQLLFFRAGKGGDLKLFFKLAESQFDESWIDKIYKDRLQNSRAKFFIRKAIGWTLRDASAKYPNEVVEFLKKNRTQMSGLSFREGSRKLPKEFKNKL